MFKEYNELLKEFDAGFTGYYNSGKFNEILNYSIENGKRIRPLVLVKTYEMIAGKEYNQTVLNYAYALEMIHNYSLVHDDLPSMDDDDYRRGLLTTHKKYGEAMAILAGDSLLNTAFDIMYDEITKSGDYEQMKQRASAAKSISNQAGLNGMIGGQVLDVTNAPKTLEQVEEMYLKKTCGLIIGATVSAAYLAGGEKKDVENMYEFGKNLGLAFQLQDDLLDYEEDKKINKLTYITLSSLEATKDAINDYSDKALSILEQYEENNFLKTLVLRLINREK